MKIFSEGNTIAEIRFQQKIDFLRYISDLLIELANTSSIYNIRQVEYFLSMAAIEASDSLDEIKKQMKNEKATTTAQKAYRQ